MSGFSLLHMDPAYAATLVGKRIRFDYLRTGEIRTGWVLQADMHRCLVAYSRGGPREHYVLWGDVVEMEDPQIYLSPVVEEIKGRNAQHLGSTADIGVLLKEIERLQDIVQTYDRRFAALYDEKQALIRSLQAKLDEALRS